jgi:hypothetical protein
MGILVVVAILVVLSALAIAGLVSDSRDDDGRYDRDTPTNPGRDPATRVVW